MNILFIGAHPDDLEILCGGTIAKCVSLGHSVTMAVATNGNVGSPSLTKSEIASIRKKEASAASRVLGAKECIWMDEDDEFLFEDKRTRLKFVETIRRAQADLIVTHNPNDYHPDHNACSKLATDARILSAVRLIETESSHLSKSPDIFYLDSITGLNAIPERYVDVTDHYQLKEKALLCHESQGGWLKSIFNLDMKDLIQIQASFRGLQAGVRFAEGYIVPSYWPRGQASLPFL